MKVEKTQNDPCPLAYTAGILGDNWNLLILREVFRGESKFEAFRKNLGIAPTMLTKRLSTLTDEGILIKNRYSEHPPRDEYLLTKKGLSLLPVLLVLRQWGEAHNDVKPTEKVLNKATGKTLKLELVDKATLKPVKLKDIEIVQK